MKKNNNNNNHSKSEIVWIGSAIFIFVVILVLLVIYIFTGVDAIGRIYRALTGISLVVVAVGVFFYLALQKKNKELIETEKTLKKNIALKQLFISIITHDLKNPILAIKFGIKELQTEKHSKEISYYIEKMEQANNMMSAMVDDAKLFSQLEDSQYKEKKTDLDLGEMLNQIVDYFRSGPYLPDCVIIDFKKPTKLYKIKGLDILKEVFMNIIDNAIKYGGKLIKIEIKHTNGNYLITLANNGKDIPDEHKEDIFERYTRLQKKSVEGTGLGLAIVRHVVQLHCGKVWVEDNPGGGVIFKIQLPIGQDRCDVKNK